MPLAAWLVSAVGPILFQALTQLGVGLVVYKGMDVAIGRLLDSAAANWSGMPGDIAAYVSVYGGNDAIAIIVGALAARITLIPLKRMRFK